eukprot:1182295-Prorocentrum_minimum.AAC.1
MHQERSTMAGRLAGLLNLPTEEETESGRADGTPTLWTGRRGTTTYPAARSTRTCTSFSSTLLPSDTTTATQHPRCQSTLAECAPKSTSLNVVITAHLLLIICLLPAAALQLRTTLI